MSTRVILTIQQEVECSLCGRHLLRGESPEVFQVNGEQRLVCELCGPRATSSGWRRGSGLTAQDEGAQAQAGGERRWGLRGLFRRPARGDGEEPAPAQRPRRRAAGERDDDLPPERPRERAERPRYTGPDFLETVPAADSALLAVRASGDPDLTDTAELAILAAPAAAEETDPPDPPDPPAVLAEPAPPEVPEPSVASRAVDPEPPVSVSPQEPAPGEPSGPASAQSEPEPAIASELFTVAREGFNASDYTERVASIARLLGPPSVSIRAVPERERAAWITIAWEICWHRYEVDGEPGSSARRVGEGMELSELPPIEREANAVLDERGALQPIA